MLTTGSNIFKCTYEQAEFIADCAGLKHKITTRLSVKKENPNISFNCGIFELWEDKQTSGGGCRIVFCNNIVWISRHSGYSWADITNDVAELFIELNCENLDSKFSLYNPHVYGEKVAINKLGIRRKF